MLLRFSHQLAHSLLAFRHPPALPFNSPTPPRDTETDAYKVRGSAYSTPGRLLEAGSGQGQGRVGRPGLRDRHRAEAA
ncbi:hypothetical protein TPA0906_17750 [Streptomyces olivaceus]|nr:hypothetical protein TPA0906_17750 [Streptomyces olivaceus]